MKKIDFETHYMPIEFTELASRRGADEFPKYDKVGGFLIDGGTYGSVKAPYFLVYDKLINIADQRIHDMDEAGIDVSVISCTPNYERFDPSIAVDACRRANDFMYQMGQRHPGRFLFYATLPVQDVKASCLELERCVKELGFVGWFTVSNYGEIGVDDRRFLPILKKVEELGCFIYMHPAIPSMTRFHGYGTQLLMGGLGFAVDVSLTLYRMICSGIMDECPGLKIMLGHYGEALPFTLDRSSARKGKWSPELHKPAVNLQPFKYYFEKNIWVTSSGNHSKAAFNCCRDVLGIDKMLFGTDYPFEKYEDSLGFLRTVSMTEYEREKFFYKNAEAAFGIHV